MWRREYHFRSDHSRRDNAHLREFFVPLTKRGIYRRKDVIGDKRENAQDRKEKFLEAMQKGCLALNLHVWSGESTI